ncbi:MAG: hypothetical protein BMS9Abin07_0502 [Acidimicrobiia bacterium]|nr:MAG: hypothetical protein BMS9Abin07_0502 [Acidimicrobiia bacterium]
MRPINETLLRHPFLTVAGALAPLLFLATSPVNGVLEPDEGPAWITWAAVGIIAYGVVSTMIFHRIVKVRPDEILLLLLGFAAAPFFIAWSGVVTFGTSNWLLSLGFIASAVLVISVVLMATRSQPSPTSEVA